MQKKKKVTKKELIGIKPIDVVHKSIKYKGFNISYTASDYGAGSSAFVYVSAFTQRGFMMTLLTLKEPRRTIREAEKEIISSSKAWIDSQL